MDAKTITAALDNTKNLILILTPLATFFLALFTINKWKKEYKGKQVFDCAFRFLKSTYELRDGFKSLRSSFIMANEILPKEEVIDNYYNQNERYILNNRLKPFQDLLNSFNSNVPEAEILFGKQLANVCKDINGIMFKYSMCLNEYLQLVGNTNNLDHLASVKKNIYNFSAQDNLKEEFDIAINKIELLVSKHLSLKT